MKLAPAHELEAILIYLSDVLSIPVELKNVVWEESLRLFKEGGDDISCARLQLNKRGLIGPNLPFTRDPFQRYVEEFWTEDSLNEIAFGTRLENYTRDALEEMDRLSGDSHDKSTDIFLAYEVYCKARLLATVLPFIVQCRQRGMIESKTELSFVRERFDEILNRALVQETARDTGHMRKDAEAAAAELALDFKDIENDLETLGRIRGVLKRAESIRVTVGIAASLPSIDVDPPHLKALFGKLAKAEPNSWSIGRRKFLCDDFGITVIEPRANRTATRVYDNIASCSLNATLEEIAEVLADIGCTDTLRKEENQPSLLALLRGCQDLSDHVLQELKKTMTLTDFALASAGLCELLKSRHLSNENRELCDELLLWFLHVPAVVVELTRLACLGKDWNIDNETILTVAQLLPSSSDHGNKLVAEVLDSLQEMGGRRSSLDNGEIHEGDPSNYSVLTGYAPAVTDLNVRVTRAVETDLGHGKLIDDKSHKRIQSLVRLMGIESELVARIKTETRVKGDALTASSMMGFFLLNVATPQNAGRLGAIGLLVLLPLVAKVAQWRKITWLNYDIQGKKLVLGESVAVFITTALLLTGTSLLSSSTLPQGISSITTLVVLGNSVALASAIYFGIDFVYRFLTIDVFLRTEESLSTTANIVSYFQGVIPSIAQAAFLYSALFFTNPVSYVTLAFLTLFVVVIYSLRNRLPVEIEKKEERWSAKQLFESDVRYIVRYVMNHSANGSIPSRTEVLRVISRSTTNENPLKVIKEASYRLKKLGFAPVN